MIQTECGKLYTGITNQLEKRFHAHSQGTGARFFHFAKPSKIVFRESHPDRSSASKRESAIKKMTREEKLLLIATLVTMERI
jgi:putative endonuclease